MNKLLEAYNKLGRSVEILHWFYTDYNLHQILGEFEENFYPLFDRYIENVVNIIGVPNYIKLSCPILIETDDYPKAVLHEMFSYFTLVLNDFNRVQELDKYTEIQSLTDDLLILLNETSYKIRMT